MKIVCNAGPLISLGKLGQLNILSQLYNEILIVPEVYSEVVDQGLRLGEPDAYQSKYLVEKSHIKVVGVKKGIYKIKRQIDIGEIATLQLALSEKADIVLIDEELAREEAKELGLKVKGTIGVLLEAFKSKYLSREIFCMLINEIRSRPDIWISDKICQEILKKFEK